MIKKRNCLILSAVILALLLTSCSRAVLSPADELCMFNWRSLTDNGNKLSLSFEGDEAEFTAESEDFQLVVRGIYILDNERLVISDADTSYNYVFGYTVHGDCVELEYGGSVLKLDKAGQ